MKLSVYSYQLHEILEQFRSRVYDADLRYLASELMDEHRMEYMEIQGAVKRSMRVCKVMELPLEAHFRPIYISRNGQVLCDWKLSAMARKLVLINGNPANPTVARLQMELLNNFRFN